jgi:hypothetical protein
MPEEEIEKTADQDEQIEEEETAGDLTDEEIDSVQPGKASATDLDFLIILFIALLNDLVIDPLFDLVGFVSVIFPVIKRVINIFVAALIIIWIYWKSQQFVMPEHLAKKLQGMEKQVITKIQAKIQKKIASKAIRRALIRGGAALGVESIPGLSLFTSWTVAVLSML